MTGVPTGSNLTGHSSGVDAPCRRDRPVDVHISRLFPVAGACPLRSALAGPKLRVGLD